MGHNQWWLGWLVIFPTVLGMISYGKEKSLERFIDNAILYLQYSKTAWSAFGPWRFSFVYRERVTSHLKPSETDLKLVLSYSVPISALLQL